MADVLHGKVCNVVISRRRSLGSMSDFFLAALYSAIKAEFLARAVPLRSLDIVKTAGRGILWNPGGDGCSRRIGGVFEHRLKTTGPKD